MLLLMSLTVEPCATHSQQWRLGLVTGSSLVIQMSLRLRVSRVAEQFTAPCGRQTPASPSTTRRRDAAQEQHNTQ